MAINPIAYTEKVVSGFLRYQLTAYPLADARLNEQMRGLLSVEAARRSPLLKGPFISLSRAFGSGCKVQDLVDQGSLHPLLSRLHRFPGLYRHQQEAIEGILDGRSTLVSTGTGSGKTECFLYPIISHGLRLRDEQAPAGVTAVLVYPMNALAEDQMGRLRGLLAGSGVSFGLYVGSTPRREADVVGRRLEEGSSRQDYEAALAQAAGQKQSVVVHPPEERCSREDMRRPGRQPRILLTNVKQLELLLTRQEDIELFDGVRLDYLVFDEAHTFSGATGAETACLIRRLRAFCGRGADQTVCVATSATLVDPGGSDQPGRDFAARFFGVDSAGVAVVGEAYAKDDWSPVRAPSPPPPGDPEQHLRTVLAAVDDRRPADEQAANIKAAWLGLTGEALWDDWEKDLYRRMAGNELVFQLADALAQPRPLDQLLSDLAQRVSRPVTEAELLTWLTLGAAARNEGRPLLRPIVHAFTRGLGGAVVTFPPEQDGPRLWLSAEDEAAERGEQAAVRLSLTTCTTCGQHYFLHHVQDFQFFKDAPGGGAAVEDRWFWPRQDALTGGSRLVLTDRLASQSDDVDGDDGSGDGDVAPRRSALVYLCRRCGALHPAARRRCDACAAPGELVALLAMQQKEDHPGWLTSCLSCGARGRPMGARYREPAREVRAVTVADVHILAQDMVRHAERRRLLVFADNRQDAAFQAGWMRDRARRYRLRALMDQRLRAGPLSVGDLAAVLDQTLAADPDLSRTLVPEVWAVYPREAAGHKHEDERRRYLRIQVLREVTTAFRQRIGLEPWGRMRVRYHGLDSAVPFFTRWSAIAQVAPESLLDGVSALLDQVRRKAIVKDVDGLFSRIWRDGDFEVQRGYMPLLQGVPKGLKLRRAAADDSRWLDHWLAAKSGDTTARQQARKWGVPAEQVDACLTELWQHLAEEAKLLLPVTLRGSGAAPKTLAGCSGSYQLDAGHFVLEAHEGLWRCGRCRRTTPRRTPHDRCPAWRCDGLLSFAPEDPDNYDLSLLQDLGAMVRPREHSAQVPHAEREQIELAFKGDGDRVNTLVCTPTLELGVDIGALDAVLMRNVPPQAANYWQRVGRAGRRHRMAVNITYARPVSHDRAYYVDPLKLLGGRVEPPRFNLRNDRLVARHVHAAVLTGLHRLAREQGGEGVSGAKGPGAAAPEILPVLEAAFPAWLRDYLFDAAGSVRSGLPDLAPLRRLILAYRPQLVTGIVAAFAQGWPEADAEVVSEARLAALIDEMPERLEEVLRRLRRRLEWALDQIERLTEVRKRKGTLDPEEDAQFSRCDRLVKRLKGITRKTKAEGEGYADTYTLGLLAADGFLPGYGLDIGTILATAMLPRALGEDFALARPPTMALRELVPGNLLYANGHRFVARNYQLAVQEGRGGALSPMLFQVDQAHEAVTEAGQATAGAIAPLGAQSLRAVPVCDVELSHRSQINDEEDYRFQLPVAVYGLRQERHEGGQAYGWGAQPLQHLRGARFRLVNVGPATAQAALGYPVCLVCGQCASPFASAKEREHFAAGHLERCGQAVQPTGFYADVVANALILSRCAGREEAYSVLEALRIGAANVLEMERDDLNLLVMGKAGQDAVEAALYDPMPGGSGLLDQLLERFGEVVAAALGVARGCPSGCERACVDCLLAFENGFYHKHLDRGLAAQRLEAWGAELVPGHPIPALHPSMPVDHSGLPVNAAESSLRDMLQAAGLADPEWHHRIALGPGDGWTEPDGFYVGDEDEPGICIYLDGLSRHIHGNPATAARDQFLRARLRSLDYRVLSISVSDLYDPGAMASHLKKLARWLLGKERMAAVAATVAEDDRWYRAPVDEAAPAAAAAEGFGWSEAMAMLAPEWQGLAAGLRDQGLPAPSDVHVDIMRDGRTTGAQAVLSWARPNGRRLLLGPTEAGADDPMVRAGPADAPAVVATQLLKHLEA